jgi:cell wall-associated NlpC family hydrolase
MRKRFVICATLALVTTAAPATAPGAQSPAERAQRVKARVVLAEIATLDANMEHVVNAWDEAHSRLATLDQEVRHNRVALRRARHQLHIARRQLALRLVAIYENGEPSLVAILLGATSMQQLVDRINATQAVVRQDRDIAAANARATRRFDRRRRMLARAASQQRANLTRLAASRATIERTLAQRRALLASVRTQIAQLEAQQRAQERQLAAVARARLAREQQQQQQQRAAAVRARLARAQRAHVAAKPQSAETAKPATPHVASRPAAPATRPATPQRPAPLPATTHASPPPPPPPPPPAPAPSSAAHPQAAAIAARYLGIPYHWGGASPATGFDCSGLVMYVYAQLGISLPHYTVAQWNAGVPVARAELQLGDLVFFNHLGHVGIYIGNNQFIHAPHTGDVVRVSSLSESWYASNYDGARRITSRGD